MIHWKNHLARHLFNIHLKKKNKNPTKKNELGTFFFKGLNLVIQKFVIFFIRIFLTIFLDISLFFFDVSFIESL